MILPQPVRGWTTEISLALLLYQYEMGSVPEKLMKAGIKTKGRLSFMRERKSGN